MEALLQESAELRTALLTPAIQNSRKRAVMANLLARIGGSPLIRNFVYVVIDHRRIAIIGEIREAFELQLDERLGFVRAEVSSAAPLDAPLSAGLESELSKLTGKRMRLRFESIRSCWAAWWRASVPRCTTGRSAANCGKLGREGWHAAVLNRAAE